MSREKLFEKAMTGLDEKYINEAAEELYKRQGEEIRVTDNRIAKPQKNSGIKMFIGVAAAVALVIGGFTVLDMVSDKPDAGETHSDISETGDKVTKYDRIVISDESGSYTEIYPEIWDEYSKLAVEMIENLEKITLTETDYIPWNSGRVDSTSISLYYGELCDEYIMSQCYSGGGLDCTIITKDGVNYEASGDELIRVMEITAELMKTSVPTLLSGEYYLDGDKNSGVYIEVKNGTICLKGDNDLDFVKANCGDMNYNDVYQALGEKEFVISSIYEHPSEVPIITEWDKTQKINANRYSGFWYYSFAGHVMNGQAIGLLGYHFYFSAPEIMEYEDTFAKGTIRFTELTLADILSINDVQLPIGTEEEAKEYFGRLSGNSTGIDRFGLTVLSDYEFDEKNSFCNAMGDSAVPNDYAQLHYALDDYASTHIDVFVGQAGSAPPELMLPTGLGLVFPLYGSEPELSEFTLDDGTVLKLKIGGATYEEQEYYTAEWTDAARGLKYKVNSKRCSRSVFLGAVISLIYDVSGIGSLTSTESSLPTNFADYEMDFQIFYDYFRGVWTDGQTTLNIGWNDNVFTYDKPLLGFYKDSNGAYMVQREDKNHYNLYFVPEYDKTALLYYNYIFADTPYSSGDDATVYNINGDKRSAFTKTSESRYSQNTGVYGYLGIWELCTSEGIDFDALHNLSFDDKDGEHWSRHNDTEFKAWGDIGVLQRNSKGYGDELVLALKFLNGDGVTEQYFLCNLKKNSDGTLTFTETPFKFDISELDYENSQTSNARYLRGNVENDEIIGTSDYWIEAKFFVYPVSDDSYYLVRQMGANQAQWLSYVDIFWYSGEIVDYYDFKPVMYTQVEGGYTAFMGGIYLGISDGYMYYLVSDLEKNEYQIACIYEGKEISRFDMGYLDSYRFDGIVHNKNGYTDVIFRVDDRQWQYRVDYSDPYNPEFIGITNLTDPEKQATLYGEYRFVHDVGDKLDKSDYTVTGESDTGSKQLMDEMYLIEASEGMDLLLKPNQTLVFTINDDEGYRHTENDEAWFTFTSKEDIIHVEVGYIADGVAHRIYYGQTDKNGIDIALSDLPTGEYQMYITNYSGYLQYYDFIGIAVT